MHEILHMPCMQPRMGPEQAARRALQRAVPEQAAVGAQHDVVRRQGRGVVAMPRARRVPVCQHAQAPVWGHLFKATFTASPRLRALGLLQRRAHAGSYGISTAARAAAFTASEK